MTEYRSYLVSVKLVSAPGASRILFSANPSIPPDTVATITLAPHASCEDFRFDSFAWCVRDPAETPFLSAANHGDSLILRVRNVGGESVGIWNYRVGICTPDGELIQSPACGSDSLPAVINQLERFNWGMNMRDPVIIPERHLE